MKDLENIDKLFSSSLENYEVTPPAEAKIAIEKQLLQIAGKKNNRKKGGWLLLLITSCSIFATAMFVQTRQKKTQTIAQKQIEAPADNTVEAYDTSNQLKENNTSNAKNETVTKKVQIEHITKVASQKSQQNNLIVKAVSSTENKISENNININEKLLNDASNSANTLSIKTTNLTELFQSNKNSNDAVTPINVDEQIKNDLIKNGESQLVASSVNNVEIDIKNDILSDSALTQTPEPVAPAKIDEPKSKMNHGFIGLLVGSGLNSNYFNHSNTIATQELKDSIKFSAPYLSAQFTGGLYFKGWEISSGLGIMQQNEKVKYSYVSQQKTQILVDSIYIDPITHDTIVKHNVTVDTLIKTYKTNEVLSQYTYLQIPLLIGYRLPVGMKWLIDFKLGGSVNMLLKSKGNYKSSYVGSLEDYSSKSNAPIRTINFNALAVFGINYQLTEKAMLQVSFPFQVGLSNVYKKEYFINKSVNSVGVQLGIKYDL